MFRRRLIISVRWLPFTSRLHIYWTHRFLEVTDFLAVRASCKAGFPRRVDEPSAKYIKLPRPTCHGTMIARYCLRLAVRGSSCWESINRSQIKGLAKPPTVGLPDLSTCLKIYVAYVNKANLIVNSYAKWIVERKSLEIETRKKNYEFQGICFFVNIGTTCIAAQITIVLSLSIWNWITDLFELISMSRRLCEPWIRRADTPWTHGLF